MKVVIFGSRGIDRLEEVEKAVEESGVSGRITEIVSGCALGVDTLALAYAEKHNLPVKLFPARWGEDGRKAGPWRNIDMAAYADYGVAVWDGRSRGTAHMIGLMEGRVFVRQTDEAERLIITEPAQVARLKAIYENCGSGAQSLDWDFSRPGRASLPRRQARGGQGRLSGLYDIFPHSSHPWARPWPEALLAVLASADFYIHLNVSDCEDDSCYEPDSDPEAEESQDADEAASRPVDGPEAEDAESRKPPAPTKDRYKNWDQVTDPADVEVLRVFYKASGLERPLYRSYEFNAELRADPFNNWVFLESGAVVGWGLMAEEGRLTGLDLTSLMHQEFLKKLKRLDLLAGLTALRKLSLDLDALGDSRGLAVLSSLEELELSGSRKTSKLPSLSGLTSVKKLNLSRLGLKSLAPLAALTTLEELDLSYNKIQNLGPLADLVSLKRLDLNNNRISDLRPLAGLAALEDLKIDDNRVSDLGPLSRLTELKKLSLPGNQVHDLAPLAGLTALEELDLTDNQVRDLAPLAGLTALEELGLTDNQVHDLAPLASLTSLKQLYASGNAITDLSPLAGLNSLKDLTLQENEINDLTPLAGLTALETLYLNDNQVCDLSPLVNLKALKILELSHNRLTDLLPLAGLTALTWLELAANQIIDLAPLARLAELSVLDLNDNRIHDLRPLAGLSSLRSLHLEGNQSEDLTPLAGLVSLSWFLQLERNLIQDLRPLARLSALENLDLADNRIRDMTPLAGLSALEHLDLKNNEITALPDLPGLVKLRTLSLGGNPLQDIRALEKICHGSARSIYLGPCRPAGETKERPPAPAPPEAARPELAGRKLLVLGLDGLLWGGTAAAGDIVFGRGGRKAGKMEPDLATRIFGHRDADRKGLAFLAFQRGLKALARRGLLLAVCSRNDHHIARQPFLTRGDMPLALEDFAAFKANWRKKIRQHIGYRPGTGPAPERNGIYGYRFESADGDSPPAPGSGRAGSAFQALALYPGPEAGRLVQELF